MIAPARIPALSLLALTLASPLLVSPALAGFSGTISFTPAEVAAHQQTLDPLLMEAKSCLEQQVSRHRNFYKKHGISAFYGDRSTFAALSPAKRREHLQGLGKSPDLLKELKPTSCIGLALECLERGFIKAGQPLIWADLKKFTKANAQDGTALQHGLQKLGWTVGYWNPDPSRNAEWDAVEKKDDLTNELRFWGYHVYRYGTVNSKQTYYFNAVDDTKSLVDFGTKVPAEFRKAPFFLGTAHTGYHVFPGRYGKVIEGHSTRSITDPQTIEAAEFNPLQNGGAPRGFYRSGLMAIPPGYSFK